MPEPPGTPPQPPPDPTAPPPFEEPPLPSPSPTFGQHSDEILAAHGYSAAEIAALRHRGVVK